MSYRELVASRCLTCGASFDEELLGSSNCGACEARLETIACEIGAASTESEGSLAPAFAEVLRRLLPAGAFAESGISYDELGRMLSDAATWHLSSALGFCAPENDLFYRAKYRGVNAR